MKRLPPHGIAPSATPGHVLTTGVDGRAGWEEPAAGAGGGAATLDDLTDVDTTTNPPQQDDVLVFDATQNLWISRGGGAVWYTTAYRNDPTYVENTRTHTSTGTYPSMTWNMIFAHSVLFASLTATLYAAGTYDLRVNGVTVATRTVTAGATVTFAPTNPLELNDADTHVFALVPTSAVRWHFRSGDTVLAGSATTAVVSWGRWQEASDNTAPVRLDVYDQYAVPESLPVVLIENSDPAPPPGTKVGAIIYRKGLPGQTNTGLALGWWDGATIQPLG